MSKMTAIIGCQKLYDESCEAHDKLMREKVCKQPDYESLCAHYTDGVSLEVVDVNQLALELNSKPAPNASIVEFGELTDLEDAA